MDSFSTKDTVLPHDTARKRTEPSQDYRRVADDSTRHRQSGESVDRGETTGVCVGGQSVARQRADDVQALVKGLHTDSGESTGQSRTVVGLPNSWHEIPG